MGYHSICHAYRALMHICDAHKEMLTEGIDPMVMPDTPVQARYLLLCLELGLYPTATTEPLAEQDESESAPKRAR